MGEGRGKLIGISYSWLLMTFLLSFQEIVESGKAAKKKKKKKKP